MPASRFPVGCAVVAAGTGAAVLLRVGYDAAFGPSPAFLLPFLVPVVAAGVFGGFRWAVAAVALNLAVTVYFFTEPALSWHVPSAEDRVRLVAFAGLGAAVGALCEVFIGYRRRAEAAAAAATALAAELERRVAERTAALAESERRFRAIFDAQFQFIGVLSLDGVVLEANRTALAAAGVAPADVIGKPFWDTVWWAGDPGQQERLRAAVRTAAAGTAVRFEARHPAADGSDVWVDFSLTPFVEDGAVVMLIPEGRDVTDRKRAAEALRASDERFRAFLDHLPLAAWATDADGRLVIANRYLGGMVGRPAAELVGKTRFDLLAPADARAHEANDRRVRESGAALELDERFVHPDGTTGYTYSVKFPVRGADGAALVGGVALDVTARKATEAALAAQEALLRQFIQHSPAAIAMFDREVRYLQASDRWLVDYHLAGRELVGRSHYDVFPDIPDRWKAVHRRVLAGAVEACDDDPFVRSDGTTEWLQWECRPWHDAGGAVGGLIMFTQVVTRRKQAEEAIRASLREKEVLLKEIHHRVKNNLQVVSALLELQAGYAADPAARAMFDESRGRVKSMALIHERLYRSGDLARVDVGGYVRRLAADLFRAYKVSADDVRLDVTADVPPLPVDSAIPVGLLLNELISNSLKHAFRGRAGGRVAVGLRRAGAETVLTVADDGVGLPPGTDARTARSFGLQLVATLAEQLGGAVELGGGPGAAVTVRFPTPETPA